MKTLYLERTYLPNGTRGMCTEGSEHVRRWLADTIEPARTNTAHPCVQEGTWIFDKILSEKHGVVFRARNIPGRTGIEWHICKGHDGKFLDYTRAGFLEGCISPGESECEEHGEPAVCGTISAFARFMNYLKDDQSFTLVIREAQQAEQNGVAVQEETVDQSATKLTPQQAGNHALKIVGFTAAALLPAVNNELAAYNFPQIDHKVLDELWSAGLTLFTLAHADVIPWVKKFFVKP